MPGGPFELRECTSMVKIAPSILAADFAKLGEEIDSVRSADLLHFDVMDGVFVPNISFGLPVIKCVRRVTELPLDVHLMITSPIHFVERFCDAGADIVTFHVEADSPENIRKALMAVKGRGKRAGLSVKPATPVSILEPFGELLDNILIMSVEPGFGGQRFMPGSLQKIAEAAALVRRLGTDCDVEVDGGINPETAPMCVEAGATVLVAGSNVFKAPDRHAEIDALRGQL